MKAKRSLGQNFLKSKSVVREIIRAGKVSEKDVILEIGPGKGVLTKELLEAGAKVLAVEKDDNLFTFLKEKFKEEIKVEKLELVHGDILETDLSHLKKYKLIANIPYNITGEILRRFLVRENQPKTIVLLLQRQVVERIVAKDGKESLLSISVKVYGEPKYIKTVPKEFFRPVPKVDSAILLIENISKDFFKDFSEKRFFELVKKGFSQKRKKLINNIKDGSLSNLSQVFEKLGLNRNIRAERLSARHWDILFREMFQRS